MQQKIQLETKHHIVYLHLLNVKESKLSGKERSKWMKFLVQKMVTNIIKKNFDNIVDDAWQIRKQFGSIVKLIILNSTIAKASLTGIIGMKKQIERKPQIAQSCG